MCTYSELLVVVPANDLVGCVHVQLLDEPHDVLYALRITYTAIDYQRIGQKHHLDMLSTSHTSWDRTHSVLCMSGLAVKEEVYGREARDPCAKQLRKMPRSASFTRARAPRSVLALGSLRTSWFPQKLLTCRFSYQ